jgi:heme/copper-type cytochrome/quinol oxidase subunit 4
LSGSTNSQNQIEGLLKEYDVCHSNRNHYDSVRWTIASLFTGFSLAAFGFTFSSDQAVKPVSVTIVGAFAISMFLIGMAYFLHIEPYIRISIDRLYWIEVELQRLGVNVSLHRSIVSMTPRGHGKRFIYFLIVIVVAFWILRLILALV